MCAETVEVRYVASVRLVYMKTVLLDHDGHTHFPYLVCDFIFLLQLNKVQEFLVLGGQVN